MVASPVVPGRLYRVKHRTVSIFIIAANGAAAICILIGLLEDAAC